VNRCERKYGSPKALGALEPHPLGQSVHPLETLVAHRDCHAECDCCWSNGTIMYVDPSEKLVFSRLGFQVQIKVFGTDTDRSVTYNDVVWVVDSEYGPISYFFVSFPR